MWLNLWRLQFEVNTSEFSHKGIHKCNLENFCAHMKYGSERHAHTVTHICIHILYT